MKAWFLLWYFLQVFCVSGENSQNTTDEADRLNFMAIKKIHAHLDDDQDGSVNHNESVGFMVDELNVHDKARHSTFHGNDSQISVEDLWIAWQQSDVYNWTTADVVVWLQDTVGLSEYEENFSKYNITGRALPRLAVEDVNFFQEIGIVSVKHRKKISLRAADVVLFGPPTKGWRSLFKDMLLLVVILFASLACWYSLAQKKQAQKQLENMMKDIEGLQQAEDDLQDLQEKLAVAEMGQIESQKTKQKMEQELLQEISAAKKEAERLHEERDKHKEEQIKMVLVEQELAEVRRALMKAEAEVESLSLRSPQELQQWLQITYRKESKHVFNKKQSALKQMEDAKEACEKIRKKRGSILGTFRLAHGQVIDEVDQKILSARAALADVTSELKERQYRWRQIESLCGFPIATDGLLNLALDNMVTTGRRSSVAQALAICANLGSIGSIPHPSNSGSEDETSCFQDQTAGQRKRVDSVENNLTKHGNGDKTSHGSTRKVVYGSTKRTVVERNSLYRRSGGISDVDTCSDTESISSAHVNNSSLDEISEHLPSQTSRPVSAMYSNHGGEKRRSPPLTNNSNFQASEKLYHRAKTEPAMPYVMSVKDFRHTSSQDDEHGTGRSSSVPKTRSTPVFSEFSESLKDTERSKRASSCEGPGDAEATSSNSLAPRSKSGSIFTIEGESAADVGGSGGANSTDIAQSKESPVPKQGRSFRSKLKARKKSDEDGETDSLKKKSLLRRLKGK